MEVLERFACATQLRVASEAGLAPQDMRPVVVQLHTDLAQFNLSQPKATQHCTSCINAMVRGTYASLGKSHPQHGRTCTLYWCICTPTWPSST